MTVAQRKAGDINGAAVSSLAHTALVHERLHDRLTALMRHSKMRANACLIWREEACE